MNKLKHGKLILEDGRRFHTEPGVLERPEVGHPGGDRGLPLDASFIVHYDKGLSQGFCPAWSDHISLGVTIEGVLDIFDVKRWSELTGKRALALHPESGINNRIGHGMLGISSEDGQRVLILEDVRNLATAYYDRINKTW